MKLIARPLIVLVGALAFPAWSSTFSVSCSSKMEMSRRGCTVKLSGKIEAGDAARLRAVIRDPLYGDWTYNTLLLDSLGGDVSEALRLAQMVREAMLRTSTILDTGALAKGSAGARTRSNWPCVSACFLVWVAGTERESYSAVIKAEGEVGIGLHRPYFSPNTYADSPAKVAELQQAMTTAVQDYLRREHVPERFIEKMLESSSRDVYWLRESGDPFALNGRAPWFEEMMIARCAWDPAYEREKDQYATNAFMSKKRLTDDPKYQAYLSWRRSYNACEYEIRRQSQANIQRAK